jgi:hypothetical protein
MTAIEVIGWLSLAIIGGGAVFSFAFISATLIVKGGLEAIAPCLVAAVLAASAWVLFVIWLSPVTIGVTP